MNLKKCPCCSKMLTTKNVEKVIRHDGLGVDVLYFTCIDCKSTSILKKGNLWVQRKKQIQPLDDVG